MVNIVGLILLVLISCPSQQEPQSIADKLGPKQPDQLVNNQDSLFMLNKKSSEKFIKITPPKNSGFELPDSSAKPKPFKYGDFNADGKEDVLVYLGACGTGGCMYGLFLKQYKNYYRLAYFDYLKNAEFKIEKNGLWTIKSSEELEPYNPSKIQVSTFKFDKNAYQYKLDTTYVYYDRETEAMMNKTEKANH